MDMLYPANLVFHYERLMSLALALCERPVSALLLGVGGAAMWRFMRAYVPMTGIGASGPLPSVPARVGLLNRQPTLGLGDGDYSSCP